MAKKAAKKKAAPSKETALATASSIGDQEFALLKDDVNAAKDIIEANLGEGGVDSPFNLDRIRIPAGGGTAWEVPTLEGEENVNEIIGVIVAWQDIRVFWKEQFTGEGNPPDCSSEDCQVGIGDPGGSCQTCDNAAFGSARSGEGRGQACKQIRRLFFLMPEGVLPVLISCPPTSMSRMRKFFTRLAGKMIRYTDVLVKLELVKAQNKDGITYSEVNPSVMERMSAEQAQAFRKFGESIQPAIRRIQPGAEDFNPE